MKASRTARITAEHVRLYSQITGDYNPLHVDPEFASATRFKKRIVQGGLTSGLLNAIVAMNLPGPGTVFLETCWRFTNPVFIGDTIVGEVEVLEVHKTKPVSRIGVRIVRSDGETVVDGHACATRRRLRRSGITHGETAPGSCATIAIARCARAARRNGPLGSPRSSRARFHAR
jgi:acyl dehydratase